MADHPDFLELYTSPDYDAYSAQQDWQKNTILGRLTMLLIRIGDNALTRFLIRSFQDQQGGDSPQARVLSIFAHVLVLVMAIFVAYAIGHIVQIVIGKEIVINQEIIIEEEVKLSDLKKALESKNATEMKQRRGAREKKDKNT
mmetsp:Transcript_16587/g.31423  ORF Transcript_16587/g.31423 Transcript_16587/m.31423 type:complete len:143 (-) Transcript_16587:266-694(-)